MEEAMFLHGNAEIAKAIGVGRDKLYSLIKDGLPVMWDGRRNVIERETLRRWYSNHLKKMDKKNRINERLLS